MFAGQGSTFVLAHPEAFLRSTSSQFVGSPLDILLYLDPPPSTKEGDSIDVAFRCAAEGLALNETDLTFKSQALCRKFGDSTGEDIQCYVAFYIFMLHTDL